MGATAEERLAKRRLNEMEEKIKKLQRELQQMKMNRKKISQLRKQVARAGEREADLQDVLEDVEEDLPLPRSIREPRRLSCRKDGCKSDQTNLITAGNRTVVVCQTCSGRYTIKNA